MVISRPSALRAVLRANVARPALRSSGPRQLQRIARRTYADGGHHAPAKSNDLTWGLGAAAVTIPGAWYLLQRGEDAHHGDEHGHGDEEHEEPADDAEEAPKEEGGEEEQKSDEGDQQGGEKQQDESKESENEDNGNVKSKDASEDGDASKDEGENQPEKGSESNEDDNDSSPKQSPPKTKNDMTAKQRGLSNTETKHSTDIHNNPEKSKKGEGTIETSKTMGTVKIDRPQR